MPATKNIITFEKSAREYILDVFNTTVDKEGYVVEKDNPGKHVLSPDGEQIKACELAGIKKGSLLFFPSDLSSLIELAERLK